MRRRVRCAIRAADEKFRCEKTLRARTDRSLRQCAMKPRVDEGIGSFPAAATQRTSRDMRDSGSLTSPVVDVLPRRVLMPGGHP